MIIPTAAFAQDWVLVSEGESGSKVYVDKTSVQKSGDNTKANVKQTFTNDQVASDKKSKYNQLEVTYIFNCTAGKVAVAEGKKINSSGETVEGDKFDKLTWVTPEPETVVTHAMEYSCNFKSK